ncbi:S8 family serine peptidase [Candidatus Sumerlaeota bacterium]|nr:S8 family serine peptidase [Candidatus Sumerlaeota bacterium]
MSIVMRFTKIICIVITLSMLFIGANAEKREGAKDVVFSQVPEKFGKATLTGNPKIASALQQVIDKLQKNPESLKAFSKRMLEGINGIKTTAGIGITRDNKIIVAIKVKEVDTSILDKLSNAGIEVIRPSPQRQLIYARLTRDEIYKVSLLPEVKLIRLPEPVVFFTGSKVTRGDFWLQTDEVRRQFNYDGTGVKVGVISDGMGFTGQSVATGDLPTYDGPCVDPPEGYYPPSDIQFYSFVEDSTYEMYWDMPGTQEDKIRMAPSDTNPYAFREGTAMMEIIYDLAPGAKLFFSNFDPYIVESLNESKDWLASQGCDIICDDIGWFNVGNLDGTNILSLKSTELVQNGHLYYTAVGNLAQAHYGGYFTDDPSHPNRIHNFIYDPVNQRYDETLEVRIPYMGYAIIALTWYEPFGQSGDDIDLYVLDSHTLDLSNPLAFSTEYQQGDGDPVEYIYFPNFGYDTVVSIVITRKNIDLTPRRMDLFVYGYCEMLEHIVPESSITCNNDAGGGVMSIGAIDVNTPRRIAVEYFSSRGPTIDGRIKPEMANYDGVETSVPGFESFYGTSAASPHAAGVAALLRQLLPYETPDQVNSYLRFFCDDLAPSGVDNISGSGRMIAYPIFDQLINTGWVNRVRTYNFNTDEEGWQYYSPPGFTAPQFSWQPGNLVMTAINNVNTFGYWVSPVVDFQPDHSIQLIADKVYQVRCRIASDANPTNFPSFRISVHSGAENEIAQKLINSTNGSGVYPPPEGRYYYLYFRPDQASIASGVRIVVDMINFDPEDSPSASLYIDEVQIKELNIPY